MIRILKPDGGGWVPEWVNRYNDGHRGLICLIIETDDLDREYQRLTDEGMEITPPEYLKFKWFFNLLTRTMPWRNSYIPFFEGVPLQLSIQQMKDQKSKDFMHQYMTPNSRDEGINGIKRLIIKGSFTDNDKERIRTFFGESIDSDDNIIVRLKSKQELVFMQSSEYSVELQVEDTKDALGDSYIDIENIHIIKEKSEVYGG